MKTVFKQNGRTLSVILDSKPYVITAPKEQLDEIKEVIAKMNNSESEKTIKTFKNKLLKQLTPRAEATIKEKERKVTELKGEKVLIKKQVKAEGNSKHKVSKEKKELTLAVKENKTIEEAVKIVEKVENKPSVAGYRRRGEY